MAVDNSHDESLTSLEATALPSFGVMANLGRRSVDVRFDEVHTFAKMLRLCRDNIRSQIPAADQVRVLEDPAIEAKVRAIILEFVEYNEREYLQLTDADYAWPSDTPEGIMKRIFSMLYRLGPIDRLLEREDVEDIAINGAGEVQIRTSRGWEECPPEQIQDMNVDTKHLEFMFNQAIRGSGQQAGPLNPIVDDQLPNGHRINLVYEPVAADGVSPLVVIRRHRPVRFTIDDFLYRPVEIPQKKKDKVPDYLAKWDLEELASAPVGAGRTNTGLSILTPASATLLHMAVLAGMNILVLGKTGVGKTVFLSMLGSFIPLDRRVLVVEDTRELDIRPGDHPHNCIYMTTVQQRLEGGVKIEMADIIKAALRQRPDHLIVGEARAAEMWDLLNAIQTGHGGNLTSVHALSIAELVRRVQKMVFLAGVELNEEMAARELSSSFHIVLTYMMDWEGRRQIKEIGRLTGEVKSGLPEVEWLFKGGPANNFRLKLARQESGLEELLRASGFSFATVAEIAAKEDALFEQEVTR